MYIAQKAVHPDICVHPEICMPRIAEMLHSKFCIRPLIKYQLQIVWVIKQLWPTDFFTKLAI